MLLSRFWYVVLAVVLGAVTFGLFLATAMYDRATLRAMGEALAGDSQVVASYLRDEVRAGRQDPHSVDALLTATGHRVGRRREWPAGLTTREVEVLRLLARGLSNRQIAGRLVISHKTVDNHVEHIYTKIGVSNRARASLFAVRQGLVAPTEDGYFSPTT